MNEIRIITAFALIIFGAFVAFKNWVGVAVSLKNKWAGIKKHYSVLPLVSLLTAGLAFLIYPLEPRMWMWAIPILDPGNWILAVGLPMGIARGAFSRKGKGAGQGDAGKS
jgi:hypothetical protein